MPKLTDTQLIILSSATQRDDGAIVLPKHLKGGAASKAVKQLLKKKLVKEIQAKPDMPVWRRDEKEGRSYALIVTRAGSAAINVEPEGQAGDPADAARDADASTRPVGRRRSGKAKTSPEKSESAPDTSANFDAIPAPRAGSKLALVVKMLGRVRGVSIDDLTEATDWLPHTARAVITSLRNKGYRIETERNRDKKMLYRIVGAGESASRSKAA